MLADSLNILAEPPETSADAYLSLADKQFERPERPTNDADGLKTSAGAQLSLADS